MKLLSDFDGVWTEPFAEGSAQGEILEQRLAEWATGADAANTRAWIAAARKAALADPTRYGWASNGRISAFGDEDPFIVHSALLHYVDQRATVDPAAAALAEAVRRNGFDSLDAFGGDCHSRAVAEVVAKRGPGILPVAAEAGRRLLESGIEIVVVSNSTPDKLLQWFEHQRVPATRHPERKPGALRVRGSARKFVLGPQRHEPLALGPNVFDVDRPSYEEILRDEHPDALARREPAWKALRLYWLIHSYTPGWLVRLIEQHAGEVERVSGGLAGLAERLVGRGTQERRS
jgi:hypothetical protein